MQNPQISSNIVIIYEGSFCCVRVPVVSCSGRSETRHHTPANIFMQTPMMKP